MSTFLLLPSLCSHSLCKGKLYLPPTVLKQNQLKIRNCVVVSRSTKELALCTLWPFGSNVEGPVCSADMCVSVDNVSGMLEQAIIHGMENWQWSLEKGMENVQIFKVPNKAIQRALHVKVKLKGNAKDYELKGMLLHAYVTVGSTCALNERASIVVDEILFAQATGTAYIGMITSATYFSIISAPQHSDAHCEERGHNLYGSDMRSLHTKISELLDYSKVSPNFGMCILLTGTSGSGKTTLVFNLARERNMHLLQLSAVELNQESLFEKLTKFRVIGEYSVVFVDDLEQVTPSNSKLLCSIIDECMSMKVTVIGCISNARDLHPSLRRSGRFDREIQIPLPSLEIRKEILQEWASSLNLKSFPFESIAMLMNGYVGADIMLVCKEAGFFALKEKALIGVDYFFQALRSIVPTAMKGNFKNTKLAEARIEDIGGMNEIKLAIKQAMEWPLKYAATFQRFNLKPPRGIMLYGPSGCGKTSLVQCISNQLGIAFLQIDIASVFSAYLGESEAYLREAFAAARSNSPCVFFFDEIDAISCKREASDSGNNNRILSTLLNEMDGVDTSAAAIIVIGATNRPEMIDSALLRPGRFEKCLYVSLPDAAARADILNIYLNKQMNTLQDEDISKLVEQTQGFSGSDLRALTREAGMIALRKGAMQVNMSDYIVAFEDCRPSVSLESLALYEAFKN